MPEIHRVQKAGGFLANGRVDGILNVTRSIGDLNYKQKTPPANCDFDWYIYNQKVSVMPDIQMVYLDQDIDFLVLACDGVWDCLTSSQAVDFIEDRLPYNNANNSDISHNKLQQQ